LTLQREGKTLDDINQLLNKQSGLNGVCGETDMRVILQRAEQGDEACLLALNLFCYRIKKYIGAYFAVLNGNVDALIFTGGIGENAPAIRQQILENLYGLKLPVVLVIHAEEEREIALQIETLFLDNECAKIRHKI
ncbi:MAG: hypothetical protein QX193_02670, partial [Methylococcales bacterium]